MSNFTASSPPTPPPRIPCCVGVKHSDVIGTYLWVRSPRTGNEVTVNKWRWPELGRLADRIVQAASQGQHTLELTKAELQSLVDVTTGAPTALQRAQANGLSQRMSFRGSRQNLRR